MSTRKLPPPAMNFPTVAGLQYKSWHLHLPPGHEYEDLFDPSYWTMHADRLGPFDLVRVVSADGAFDVMLSIVRRTQSGLVVEPWPKPPAEAGNCPATPARRRLAS
jgi:hypothetical protein